MIVLVLTVPTSWVKEPGDTWVLEGIPRLISCEADGFPHPFVILSRETKEGRQEVSRGIKTASTNITIFSQDKEARSYICEASNEAAKLQKEFKILLQGQFCLLNLLLLQFLA